MPRREKQIIVAQGMYAKTWAVNAEHYEAQGLYAKLGSRRIGRRRRHPPGT